MPGRVRRMEIETEGFSDISVVNELHEDYFREVARTTVKPVLERLRVVYDRHGRRYPWNAIVAIGMRLWSLHRRGVRVDAALAKRFDRWGLPDNVIRDIVAAVAGGGAR